jgi:hypothetical protein
MKRIAIGTVIMLAAVLNAQGGVKPLATKQARYVAVVTVPGPLGALILYGEWRGANAKKRCEAWAAKEPARDKRVAEGGAVCMPVLSAHGGGK